MEGKNIELGVGGKGSVVGIELIKMIKSLVLR